MNDIKDYLAKVNKTKKALSVYLTAGYPSKNNFDELVLNIFDAGADLIELGIPFSDPLADGKTIQASSQIALDNGITVEYVFEIASKIKEKTDKPIILMTYANPILNFGLEHFLADSTEAKISGIIIPDLPLEESNQFFGSRKKNQDIILLTTPASSKERIKQIDKASEGFLYCVSVMGITGTRKGFTDGILNNLKRTYQLVSKNKMLVGFGISNPEDIKQISPFCDGVIVGSAVIKSLGKDNNIYSATIDFVKKLSKATYK